MLPLLRHVILTSARRDRTEVNDVLLEALVELFEPLEVTIYRCYGRDGDMVVFACAGISQDGRFVRNAYLPDRQHCQKITTAPLLDKCRQLMMPVQEDLPDGHQRQVFPINQSDQLMYLLEITLKTGFSATEMVALMGITEYFSNHIGLLNYGETDTLTGLSNRKTFDKHLFEVLGAACGDVPISGDNSPVRRQIEPEAKHWLAVCDIDKFKTINDTYGHLIGDEVLVVLAQLMRKEFRFDDQLFRFGGEEFVVVLQPSSEENALRVFNRFRERVAEYAFSQVGQVSISIGVTSLQPHDLPTDAIGRADEALYFAKQNGRNQVRLYETLVAEGHLAAKSIKTDDVELF